MSPRDRVRCALAGGPLTAEQLSDRTGLPRSRVDIILEELAARGEASRRKVYQWHGRGGVCSYPGCDTVLRHSNTSGFCALHREAGAREAWEMLPAGARLAALATVPPEDRLESLGRLGLEAVTLP